MSGYQGFSELVPPNSPRVHVNADDARWLGIVELRARLEALSYLDADVVERFADDPDASAAAFARAVHDQVREALTAELHRRERLYAAGYDVPNPHDRRYDAWLDLAREVRERADVVVLLAELGYAPVRTGHNASRAVDEYHSPCPVCGGTDRFISWPPGRRPSLGICRQCGTAFDAIALVRNSCSGCGDFYPAVGELAKRLGLPLPAEPARARQPRLRVREVTRG